MGRLSKRQRWVLGIACFLLFGSIALGILFRGNLRSDYGRNEDDLDFDYEDAEEEEERKPVNLMEELSCLDIGQTFRGFWDCMVEGLPRSPKEPASRAPAVLRMKKVNVSRSGTSDRKRRGKRHEPQRKTSHYSPLDPEMVFNLIPVPHHEWKDEEFRQEYNDYTKWFDEATSEYLFEYDPDPEKQFNPPWSYHGSNSPKEWHRLDIEKFLPPLADGLTARQAMFRDFYVEKEYFISQKFAEVLPTCETLYQYDKKNITHPDCEMFGIVDYDSLVAAELKYFSFLLRVANMYLADKESLDVLFPPVPENEEAKLALDQIPNSYYLLGLYGEGLGTYADNIIERLQNISKTWAEYENKTLRKDFSFEYKTDPTSRENLGKSGFYSSMRFLLPPDIKDKELTALRLEERVGLPRDFVRANRNALRLNEYLIDLRDTVFDDTTNKTINQMKKDGLMEVYNGPFFTDVLFKTRNFTNDELLHAVYKFIQDDIDKSEDQLVERARYSLQLFPLKFRICSHNDQSPININTSMAIHAAIGPFSFGDNACRRYKMRVSFPSDGTNVLSVKLQGASRFTGTAVTLEEGAVRGEMLYFDEMHVHIGRDETSGSEHRLNGKGYAMELQLIFSVHGGDSYSPYYYTLARQMNDLFPVRERLVLILAVFVEVVAKPENKYLFEPLAQVASQFRKVSENETMKGRQPRGYHLTDPVISIREFIPDSVYYTYRGSLTIPPCFPYVIWSVFEKPLQISREQYEELRIWPTPSADDTDFLAGNIRDPEDIYSEDEHETKRTQEEKDILKELRNNRMVIKSNPVGWNPDYFGCTNCGSSNTLTSLLSCFIVTFYLFVLIPNYQIITTL